MLANAIKTFKDLPPIRDLRKIRYENLFRKSSGLQLYRGIYKTFNEAISNTPQTKPLGYDHQSAAVLYEERLSEVYPSDYPAMFWLDRIFRENDIKSVFDIGGYVGIAYYAYEKYIKYPDKMSWKVCDVAAVVEEGKVKAKNRERPNLQFTTDFKHGDGFDVIFSSGALQYVDDPQLGDLVSSFTRKPKFILLNRMPVHSKDEYVTIQNIGSVYCPYRIFNEQKFLTPLLAQGYELVDRWKNLEHSCVVPFNEELGVTSYTGMLLKLGSR